MLSLHLAVYATLLTQPIYLRPMNRAVQHTTLIVFGTLVPLMTLSSCSGRAVGEAVRDSPYAIGFVTSTFTLAITKVSEARGKWFCPENVICEENRKRLVPGFRRVNSQDPNDWRTEWSPGITNSEHSHIVAADGINLWKAESGYVWTSGERKGERRVSESLDVKWSPGIAHNKFAHVIAAQFEGEWKTENGYVFVNPADRTNLSTKIDCSLPPLFMSCSRSLLFRTNLSNSKWWTSNSSALNQPYVKPILP